MSKAASYEEMPRKGLPASNDEHAMLAVACSMYADDMAGAIEDGRMVEGYDVPTAVMRSKCDVRGKTYQLTVTVSLEPVG